MATVVHAPAPAQKASEPEADPTLESVVARRARQTKERLDERIEATASEAGITDAPLPVASTETQVTTVQEPGVDAAAPGSPGELEEEAEQQGAFNEETGEINWDCPCLGAVSYTHLTLPTKRIV